MGQRARLERADEVADADFAGTADLGEDALLVVHHAFAESLAEGVHLGAGVAGRGEEEDGLADLDFAAEQRDEVEARGFDIRTDSAGSENGDAQGVGMGGNLLAFNEGDLAFGGLAGIAAAASEVARLALDAVHFNEVDGVDGGQRLARFDRVQV